MFFSSAAFLQSCVQTVKISQSLKTSGRRSAVRRSRSLSCSRPCRPKLLRWDWWKKLQKIFFTDVNFHIKYSIVGFFFTFFKKCIHCEKTFLSSTFLESHIQRRHPEELESREFKQVDKECYNMSNVTIRPDHFIYIYVLCFLNC